MLHELLKFNNICQNDPLLKKSSLTRSENYLKLINKKKLLNKLKHKK